MHFSAVTADPYLRISSRSTAPSGVTLFQALNPRMRTQPDGWLKSLNSVAKASIIPDFKNED